MVIEDLEWKELFTTKQKCDFCERYGVYIAKLTVHPMMTFDKKREMNISGIVMAKKCWKCCEMIQPLARHPHASAEGKNDVLE